MRTSSKLIYTALMLCWTIQISAKTPVSSSTEAAFKDGERLAYAVSYKVGILNSDLAEVTFATKKMNLNGEEVFNINAIGRVYPFYKWFFDLNDSYISNLDAKTLLPVDLTVELSEGKYRFSSYQSYDWDNMQIHSRYRNHKNPEETKKTMPLQKGSGDALALFYNMRGMDIENFEVGKPIPLHIVLEDTVRKMHITYLGKETKNVRGTGKFKTLKFKGEIVTSTGESFKDGSEFTVWFSDDLNKIPIYVETPIRVGSVRVRLLNYDNLKYPFTSKL